jgi:hypothetical protein
MEMLDKAARKITTQRAKVMFARLTEFYAKTYPDYSTNLNTAQSYYADLIAAYKKANDLYNSGYPDDARNKIDEVYRAGCYIRDNFKQYTRTKKIDKVLLEKHIWTFIQECRNPYVDFYNKETGNGLDDLCFDIGPYDLEYKGCHKTVGPYRIKLNLAKCIAYNGGGHFEGFRAFAANEWVYTYQGKIHPHDMEWGNNLMCTGQAGKEMCKHIKEGRIMEAVRMSEALMSHFTEGANYTPFLVFAQHKGEPVPNDDTFECHGCGETYDLTGPYYKCEEDGCNRKFCEECAPYCPCCERYYCDDHFCDVYTCKQCGEHEYGCTDDRGSYCEKCGNYFCLDHTNLCADCGDPYCVDHGTNCADCGDFICIGCEYRVVEGDDTVFCHNCIGTAREEYAAEQAAEEAELEGVDE